MMKKTCNRKKVINIEHGGHSKKQQTTVANELAANQKAHNRKYPSNKVLIGLVYFPFSKQLHSIHLNYLKSDSTLTASQLKYTDSMTQASPHRLFGTNPTRLCCSPGNQQSPPLACKRREPAFTSTGDHLCPIQQSKARIGQPKSDIISYYGLERIRPRHQTRIWIFANSSLPLSQLSSSFLHAATETAIVAGASEFNHRETLAPN